MSKGFWAVIAVIVIIFGGILLFKGHGQPNASNAKPTNHVEGLDQKGVTLVEYGDYQCPFCEEYYPVVKQIAAKYSAQITFQFRNLPLTQLHPNAFAAARAAEAAGLQNKFWQMHDALYEQQSQWVNTTDPTPVFNSFAKQLGLNITQFDSDFSSPKVNDLINADINAFNKTGNEMATPTFFLDGKKISPTLAFTDATEQNVNVAASVDEFSKLLDQEISTKSVPAATPSGSQSPQSKE